MITVNNADQLIKAHVAYFPSEECSLADSLSMILRENVVADRDYPPVDTSAMDGYAIKFSEWQKGTNAFSICGIQPAGKLNSDLQLKNGCIEVMTGATIPEGADCVVPIEDVENTDGRIMIRADRTLAPNQFVRKQANYCQTGQVLLSAGHRIKAKDLVVAAEVGKTKLLVSKWPSIAVVSSGDELCLPDKPVADYQTRQSNIFGIKAALNKMGVNHIDVFHIKDDKEEINKLFFRLFAQYQVIITSGAVSKGKFDFIPEVLHELKASIIFHGITQKPGKPLLFAKTSTGRFFFGLPGNPLSTQICLYRYVLPFLEMCAGQNCINKSFLPLAAAVTNRENFTMFLPVEKLADKNDSFSAMPITFCGSGDFTGLARCSGFVELEPNQNSYEQGKTVRYFSF